MGLFDGIFGKPTDPKEDIKRKLEIDRCSSKPLGVVSIHDVFKITGVGIILVGEVTQGNIRPGYIGEVNGKQIEIKTLEMNHKQIEIAISGDEFGFTVSGISDKSDIKQGDVLHFRQKNIH